MEDSSSTEDDRNLDWIDLQHEIYIYRTTQFPVFLLSGVIGELLLLILRFEKDLSMGICVLVVALSARFGSLMISLLF
jgi:hypothetical protein